MANCNRGPLDVDDIKTVKLRKISSLDGSETFDDIKEKREFLRQKESNIEIPKYGKEPPYKNSKLKRMYSRARYFGSILKEKSSATDYPIIAIIVVNNKCNWSCNYCFGDYPNRRDMDYTTDEIKFLVDELYNMGTRYINMHGGETLLRKDMGELCDYVKNKGMYLGVITNGSLFPEKLDDVQNVDSLTISLDGNREGNDKNRGPGTFDTAIAAIKMVSDRGLPLRVSATLTKHTMYDIPFLATLAHSMNFHLYFSILFKPLKQAKDAEMTNDEIRYALREIDKYRNMGYPIFTSKDSIKAAVDWPFDYNKQFHAMEKEIPDSYRDSHVECYYSRSKFTIEADGYIYPCFLTTDGSFKPKNWREVGVREAIRHVQKTNTCKACPALSQNDHNLLLGLKPQQILHVVGDQVSEALKLKGRIKSTDSLGSGSAKPVLED